MTRGLNGTNNETTQNGLSVTEITVFLNNAMMKYEGILSLVINIYWFVFDL